MGEVPVGLYIKLLKPPNTHYFIGVRKDVASLDGHGRLASRCSTLRLFHYDATISEVIIHYRCFKTIARSQRSYHVTSSEAILLAFTVFIKVYHLRYVDTGTKATDRKPITSKLVCGGHKVQG